SKVIGQMRLLQPTFRARRSAEMLQEALHRVAKGLRHLSFVVPGQWGALPHCLHLLPEGGQEGGEVGPDVVAVGALRAPERVLGLLEVPTGGHQHLVVLRSAWIGARAGRLAVLLDMLPRLGDLSEGLVTPLPEGYERVTLRHQGLILGAVAFPGGLAGIPEITLREDDRTQGVRPLRRGGLLLQGRLVLIDAMAPGLAIVLAFAVHEASLPCS